jgi:NADP-reducing hydrogenase subunit HndB
MNKVKTLDDLKKLKTELQDKIKVREKGLSTENIVKIKVAMATCGIAAGAKGIMDFFIEEMNKRNIEAVITQTGCMGYCYAEPTVEITLPNQEPVVFGFVDVNKADDIIEKYIKNGELIDGIIPVNYQTIDKK